MIATYFFLFNKTGDCQLREFIVFLMTTTNSNRDQQQQQQQHTDISTNHDIQIQ